MRWSEGRVMGCRSAEKREGGAVSQRRTHVDDQVSEEWERIQSKRPTASSAGRNLSSGREEGNLEADCHGSTGQALSGGKKHPFKVPQSLTHSK